MVVLHEEVEIAAPFEKLCAWVDNFEEEFVRWSPYHIECQLLDGGVQVGNRVRFYEIVMGLDYDVTGSITVSERSNTRFKISWLSDKKSAAITFEGEKTVDGCKFSHTEEFGLRTPVIGPIMNFLIFKVLYKKKANWKLIQDDMILDNQHLTDILTEGRYPNRIPLEQLKSDCFG